MTAMDTFQRDDLAFPRSLPEFQQQFPNDAACAGHLGNSPAGLMALPAGGIAVAVGEPFRIVTRPGVLECCSCCRQTGLLVGTVMERSHTPPSTWFWAAYLVASQTPGMSAVQFQRQLGRPATRSAFGILRRLRAAAMVRPDQDRICGTGGRTCRGGRNLCWRKDTRRGPGRPPQDAGGRCRRSPLTGSRARLRTIGRMADMLVSYSPCHSP